MHHNSENENVYDHHESEVGNGHHNRPKTSTHHESNSKLHTAPQNVDEDSLPQYIEMLQEHQALCEREGRYVEAEMAKQRLVELKKQLETERVEEAKARQIEERAQLEHEHIEEFKEFNNFWDKRMSEFDEQARTIEEQMILRHQEELERFTEELDIATPLKPKDTPELLNLKKIQQSLAKKKDYIEAHKVQQRCMKLEKEETDKWLVIREKKILNQRAQLEQKHINELSALRKRIMTGQDEQRKARSLELERLLQKYQNMRKELDTHHQHELIKINNKGSVIGTSSQAYGSKARVSVSSVPGSVHKRR